MERILVIQTAFIGDAILTLPMIQELKKKFADSVIDVVCIPSTSEIFSSSPSADNVIVLDKKGKHKSLFSLWNFIKELRKNNYTKIFSPHRSFRISFIVMNLNVKETYGFSNSSFRHVYKNLIEYKPSHHEVRRNLDLIESNVSMNWKILPQIDIHDQTKIKVDKYFSETKFNGDIISIAPGSVWNTKKYPIEYLESVIKFLIDNSFKIILIGSEKEKPLCDLLKEKFDGKVQSSAGIFTLVETVGLLKKTRLLITNDSAPTHLGMCADIPVLTLYCSTVPEFGFYPYNGKSTFLSINDLYCKPCGIHGYEKCPVKNFACGYNLKPEIVISKIKEMLND